MSKAIDNPIFGKTTPLEEDEKTELKIMIENSPISVFQELNKKLNQNGFCLAIDTISEMN